MTWADIHQRSEALASEAFLALRSGRVQEAAELYSHAAAAEEAALRELDKTKPRTLGITAVSAVSLWFKAKDYKRAEQLAFAMLGSDSLPEFAVSELRLIVQTIWTEKSKQEAGVTFLPGQVVVSVKGGTVVTGGAPLDLIVDKVQTIQSLFYRTIEFLKDIPHRARGGPLREIQESCRPWLFQAPPGSYQFSVAIQEPAQKDFFRNEIKPEQVALHFMGIIKATANDQQQVLAELVPDQKYRSTFLKLTRNLAPTGKTFESMEIKSEGETRGVLLVPESRPLINKALRVQVTVDALRDEEKETVINGTLRAVHLDKDWLDVSVDGQSVHVEGLKDTIDDVIGPMVNRQVIVHALKDTKNKLKFVDIELDE